MATDTFDLESRIKALLHSGEAKWKNADSTPSPVNVFFSFMTQVPAYYATDDKERNNGSALL